MSTEKLDRNLYATQGLFLERAEELQADALTVEMDMGVFRLTLAEALEEWELLMPGEGFTIKAIYFDAVED